MSDFARKQQNLSDDEKLTDRKNFEKLFRSYYAKLCNFAVTYTRNRSAAEDIVQNVFLKLWEEKEVRDGIKNPKAYLFQSVRNEALNYIRFKDVRRDAQGDILFLMKEREHDAKEKTNTQKIRKELERGIQHLPERCREIFLLSRKSGLTYREIAKVLDLSVKTVETQMSRAFKRLRKFASEHLSFSVLAIYVFISIHQLF